MLSLDDLRYLTLAWERDPKAPAQALRRPGKDEVIDISRFIVISQIIAEPRLKVEFSSKPLSIFDHAVGWQQVHVAILDLLDEEMKNGQPDQATLENLKADKEAVKKRLEQWQENYNRLQRDSLMRKGGLVSEADTEEMIRDNADQLNKESLDLKEEAPPAQVAGEERISIQPTPRQETNAVEPAKPGLTPAQIQERRILQERAQRVMTWQEYLRHPRSLFGVFSNFVGGYWKKFTGQEAKQDAGLAGQASQAVKNEVAKRSFSLAARKFFEGVATKLGLTAISGGVAGVLLVVKELVTSKEARNIAKNVATAAGIYTFLMINLLMSNALTLIGGIGGALAGMVIGFSIGGPIGAIVGFGVGAGVGAVLGNILASSFGIGGGAIPTGMAALPAGAVSSGFAGASAGAFGAGSAATVTGFFGAASAAITAFLGGGVAPVLIGVGGVAVLTFTTVINAASAFVAASAVAATTSADGALISVQKTVDKDKLLNDSNATLTYTIKVVSKDSTTVELADSLVNKKENLSLAKGEEKTFTYSYAVTAKDNNSDLVNTVSAVAKAGEKTETISVSVKTTIGGSQAPLPSGGSCPLAPENNACSVANLSKYFSSDKVENASRICYRESTGNSGVSSINDMCTKNIPAKEMRGYSVGMFQINLWAHDNLCKQILGNRTPFNKPFYVDKTTKKSCVYPDCTPCDRDEDLLKQCADYWREPENNIAAAKDLSGSGSSWSAWEAAQPKYCNIP